MSSNIFLKNTSEQQTINLAKNKKVNLYLVANDGINILKNINISLLTNCEVNIYCLVLANNNNKVINFNIHHKGDNNISNIFVKALASNKSQVKINCVSSCDKNTKKNTVNQTIDGLIFDNESLIQALPCLDINTNDIMAKHTVNIGQIDPEIIFYLNTKGLSNLEAYEFLISNFLNEFGSYFTSKNINVQKEINNLIGGKYE